jgi:hypothetical protein
MSINFVTFSNYKYTSQQQKLNEFAKTLGLNCFPYTFDEIKSTDFYLSHSKILDREKGSGFCLWKPYIILETLKKIGNNEILFYIDSADIFTKDALEIIEKELTSKSMCFLQGYFPNQMYTKRDTFHYMGCDYDKYWNANQCEAGVLAIKNNNHSIDFVSEWFEYCKDERIITDDPNTCGLPNLPIYVDHRYDQSILSNLIIKHDKPYFHNAIRDHIKCNVNECD